MFVNNMPARARNRKYIVVRIVDGEAWFYDAWDNPNDAFKQAREERGEVLLASEIERLEG